MHISSIAIFLYLVNEMISYITIIPELLIGSNKSGGKSGSGQIPRGEGGAAARLIRKVNW